MEPVYHADGEIFLGLVGAVGTDLHRVENVLQESLLTRKYRSISVHLSALFGEILGWKHVPSDLDQCRSEIPVGSHMREDDRITKNQNMGNMVRKVFNKGEALALFAISALRAERDEWNAREGRTGKPNEPIPLPRTAFILNSLKHPHEVSMLRQVYGRRFFLIAAYSPKEKRIEQLAQKIAGTHDNPRWREHKKDAEPIVNRDEQESGQTLGQNVRDTFPLADVFVNATDPVGDTLKPQIQRFVELVFGNVSLTPTREEFGMFHAYAASARSAALSRQVGASITDSDGGIIALGTNEVPKAGGGLYWPGDLDDARDITKGFDQSDKMERAILKEILDRLNTQKWLVTPQDYSVDQLASLALAGPKELVEAERFADQIREGKHDVVAALHDLFARLPIEEDSKKKIERLLDEILTKGVHAENYLNSLVEAAFSPVMKGAMFTSLTEYSRTVHAEMAALMEALRHGSFTANSTLYSTTFPCHVCTRHVVASGISRVVYIAPYPKSYAEEQHGDAISVEKIDRGQKVSFVPFVGVAPRQYLPFFSLEFFDRRREDDGGNLIRATIDDSPMFREPAISYLYRESDMWGQTAKIIKANWLDEDTDKNA
jgi:deoxycytidylate deaminase